MVEAHTTVMQGKGSIGFAQPVEGAWRGAVGTLSGALLTAAVSVIVLARPGFDLFPDAFVWFGCGLSIALGSAGVTAALSGIERVVSFHGASASVVEELRTRFGTGISRHLSYEDCGSLGALREDVVGGSVWHLFLIDARDGSAIEIGDFDSEEAMRRSAAAIAAVRPDIALG
jgi:hypothetical protein